MFKLVEEKEKENKRIIKMGAMKPLQIGRIVSKMYFGEIVMRSASLEYVEIMSLSNPKEDSCWSFTSKQDGLDVELLNPGERIILEVTD